MFLSYFCFTSLISSHLAFFLKSFHRLLLLLYRLPGTTNSQAPLKAPSLLNGARKALLNFPHLSQTPPIVWTGFPSRGAFPSAGFKRGPDNSVRQLKLEKINLILSREMKGFYLLELLCSKCDGELASTDRRKHITLQEETQAQLKAALWCLLSGVQASNSTFLSAQSWPCPLFYLIWCLWSC